MYLYLNNRMNKIIGIYKITNPKNKIYIGQSINILRRKYQYSKKQCKRQYKIYNSINKYGWKNHKFEILYECNINELNTLEESYIKKFNSFSTSHGLNLTSGGDSRKHTKETLLKASNRMIGNKIWLGKHHTNESKQKISKSNMNRKFSIDTRKKMSDSAKNKIVSLKTRKKMSINRKGKKISKSQIDKMLTTKLKKYGSIIYNLKSKPNSYEIYDNNNMLQHKFTHNFKIKIKELNLPYDGLIATIKNNNRMIRGKYKGWYAIKL